MAAPRNIVSLEEASKAYAAGPVLERVSLGISAGDKIGVVGPNGGGKSTLLRLIARTDTPDTGTVTHQGGLLVGMLAQADGLAASATIREIVIGGRADHEWAGDARIRDVLDGLLGGVEITSFPDGLDTRVGPLSGGERRRIALARLLLDGPELLLLDEPTNHLDIEGIDWLARHLSARRGAHVVVTHDRWFLDAACVRTWEVAAASVHQYDGGYAAYVLERAERERRAAVGEERRQNLLRKELAWLRRGPPARTSKPQFRIDAANALIADEPPARNRVELLRFASARLGKRVFDLEDVTLELGSRTLLKEATWRIGPGDRIGLVGVNGSGKTSVLRLLTGELAAAGGEVERGQTIRLAYLSQQLAELDPAQRVLEALTSVRPQVELGGGKSLTAGQLAERFGFGSDRQWTPVGDLSGGERRRLQLMRLLMDEPNVLLLDEPTNDLDTDTLAALEDVLDGWPGSIIVVSHDRWFLERVCDDVYALLGDARIRHLPGGVDEYLALRRAAHAAHAAAQRREAPAAKPKGAVRRDAQREAARLERAIAKLVAREEELHAAMVEQATDYAKVADLDTELKSLLGERERLEEAWLEAAELAGG